MPRWHAAYFWQEIPGIETRALKSVGYILLKKIGKAEPVKERNCEETVEDIMHKAWIL